MRRNGPEDCLCKTPISTFEVVQKLAYDLLQAVGGSKKLIVKVGEKELNLKVSVAEGDGFLTLEYERDDEQKKYKICIAGDVYDSADDFFEAASLARMVASRLHRAAVLKLKAVLDAGDGRGQTAVNINGESIYICWKKNGEGHLIKTDQGTIVLDENLRILPSGGDFSYSEKPKLIVEALFRYLQTRFEVEETMS